MSNNLLTQEGLLNDIKKRKQLENLYKKKMAKVEPIVPDLQSIQSKYIVTDTDLPFLKRQTGESDDDYNARMEQLKVNNSEVLEKYYEQNINLLKKNLSTLIPNQQNVYELVGELSKEPKDIVLINSYWKKFKKSLNDNFDSISFADFVLFLNNFLEILNKPNEIEDDSGNLVPVDKAKELENIDIGISDEINRFLAASEIIQNKSNVPQIRTIPEVAYKPANYPNLDELGRDKATMEEIRKEEKKKVLEKLMKRKEADDLLLNKIDAKKGLLSEEFESFIKAKRKEAMEKKKLEAKILDDKSKSIDPKTPKVEAIKSDEIIDEIIDEGTSSTPAVEELVEKEKGLTTKKEEKKKEKTDEEAIKKIAEEESGFVSTFEDSDAEETPKKPPKDFFTSDEVIDILKNRINEYGGITDFSKNEYKNRYSVRGQTDDDNKEFVKNINIIMSTLDPISAGSFKKKLQGHLKEEDIIKFLVPYVTNYKNKLVEKGATKDEATYDSSQIFGFGLNKSKKIVKLQFGRYILNKNKLDNQNILQVLHENSLNQVKFFKSTYISDDMKDLIYYIVEKKSFSPKLYKMMDNSEQDLFNMLLDKSGLKKQLNINLGSSKYSDVKKMYKDLKEEYEILNSQIESGNDSPIVQKELNKTVKELKQIITHLAKIGEISKANATNMILSL